MIPQEKIKKYFWAIFSAVGMVFFWAGIWDGIGALPILNKPINSLLIGAIMLISSGYLFKQFDPLESLESSIIKVLHEVHHHPQPHQFHIKYHDKLKNKDIFLKGNHIKKIEKKDLILKHQQGKEIFIPIHRIKEVVHNNKTYWKY